MIFKYFDKNHVKLKSYIIVIISYKFYQSFLLISSFTILFDEILDQEFHGQQIFKREVIAKKYRKLNAISARNIFGKKHLRKLLNRAIYAYFLEFVSFLFKKKKKKGKEKERLERKLRKNPWHRTL